MSLHIDQLNGSKAIWYKFPRAVKITGRHGFSVAPPDVIKEITVIQAVRWFKRGQQAFADTSAIINLGQMAYTKKLDPDMEQVLSGFIEPTFA